MNTRNERGFESRMASKCGALRFCRLVLLVRNAYKGNRPVLDEINHRHR